MLLEEWARREHHEEALLGNALCLSLLLLLPHVESVPPPCLEEPHPWACSFMLMEKDESITPICMLTFVQDTRAYIARTIWRR